MKYLIPFIFLLFCLGCGSFETQRPEIKFGEETLVFGKRLPEKYLEKFNCFSLDSLTGKHIYQCNRTENEGYNKFYLYLSNTERLAGMSIAYYLDMEKKFDCLLTTAKGQPIDFNQPDSASNGICVDGRMLTSRSQYDGMEHINILWKKNHHVAATFPPGVPTYSD